MFVASFASSSGAGDLQIFFLTFLSLSLKTKQLLSIAPGILFLKISLLNAESIFYRRDLCQFAPVPLNGSLGVSLVFKNILIFMLVISGQETFP